MKKVLFGLVFSSFLLFLFQVNSVKNAEAQSCGGSWACRIWETDCQTPSGGSCDVSDPPDCVCQEFCPSTMTTIPGFCSGLSQAQCGNINFGNPACCSATDVSDGCFWSAPSCGPSNCFSRPCSNGSGCTCYGVCSGSSCVEGGVVPGTCPAPPTPTPGGSCGTPGAYCNDFCVGCGIAQNYVCNSTGSSCSVPSSTYSQPLCDTCGAWCPSHPSCGGGGSPPTPTPDPGGGGGPPVCNAPNQWCSGFSGAICCAQDEGCDPFGPSCTAPGGGVGGCPGGQAPVSQCVGNSCQAAGCGWFSSCSTDIDCSCGNGICDSGENFSNCPADCSYDITGRVYIDANNNGSLNIGESGYNGATMTLNPGALTDVTSGSFSNTGRFDFNNQAPGAKTLTLTLPSGYQMSSGGSNTNPRNFNLSSNTTQNFGIRQAVPVCVPAQVNNSGSSTINPGASTTLSVTNCTDVENPPDVNPPPPITWDPDTGGNTPVPTVNPINPAPSCAAGVCSSTTTWTAPSCPTTTNTYTPQVTVAGPGGTASYTTSITVPSTYNIAVNVRNVASAASCLPSDGVAYDDGAGNGANINVVNTTTSTSYGTQETGTSIPGVSFTCLPGGGGTDDYQVSLQSIPGYSIVRVNNNGTQTSPGSSPVNVVNLNSNRTVTFCIAPIDPWFQTTTGDVRFVNLTNPVPSGQFASEDPNYPGIFYSSASNADFGLSGAAGSSAKGWVINNEYSFNSDTANRNGGMSYDFYRNKTFQDGVTIRDISAGTLDWGQIDPDNPGSINGGGSGVYEAPGDITINTSPPASIFNATNRSRVVILTEDDVTIDASITIPSGQGFLIVAAKGDITISNDVGTSTLNSNVTQLDGFYTAQERVIIESRTPVPTDLCTPSGVDDLRLNVGGALIANSLKPFASSGYTIQNNRSLCLNNLNYPTLYVVQRADFLTQFTDFYKTSYTKWREVNP